MTRKERAHLRALWMMINGYQTSQAAYVAAKLGIADLLKDGPKCVDELARATNTHAPTLYRLLRVLVSVGVFAEARDGRFRLTPRAKYLQSDVPHSMRGWALMLVGPTHWSSWGELLHSVRTGEAAFNKVYGMSSWEYRERHPEEGAMFDAVMAVASADPAVDIVSHYDFSGISTLVDVGGGKGVLLAAILAANPSMRGILIDQPHVVAAARDTLEQAGVADRCEVVGGSFLEAVPPGADAYLLRLVIHNWGDEQARQILKTCRAAMPPTGKLLLIEQIIQPGNEFEGAKFMDMMMLLIDGGRERTADEFERLCAESGFRVSNIFRMGSGFHIIEAAPA